MAKRVKRKKTVRKKRVVDVPKAEPMTPAIKVLVPRTDRLVAINSLAQTVSKLADALCRVPIVHVTGCIIKTSDIGINIGFQDEPLEELRGSDHG